MQILIALVSLLNVMLLPPQGGAQDQQPAKASIVFAGDAMQHGPQLETARRSGGVFDYSGCFDEIAPYVSAADYAVVNLETTLNNTDFTGYPCFSSPVSYAKALQDAGFDMALTANNHTLDRRDAGLRRTITYLDSLGLDHIGTYPNAAARAKALPFIKNINGIKVGFINYTYGTNGIRVQGDVVVDYIDRDVIARDITAARRAGAEILIAIPHWGAEYHLIPGDDEKSLAKFLCDKGVDVVMGGHPHVVQPMEMNTTTSGKNQLVVYSLGNFVSAMRDRDCRGGAMVKVNISRDAQCQAKVDDAEYRLVFTIPGENGRRSHRLITVDSESDYARAGSLSSNCRAFTESAMKLFGEHNRNVPRHAGK